MRGMTTVEWLVIAAIVLLASKYLLNYWGGIWNPTKQKAEELGQEFNETLDNLNVLSERQFLPQQGHRVLPLEDCYGEFVHQKQVQLF